MDKETNQSGTEYKDRAEPAGNTVKKPSLKLEMTVAVIAWIAVGAQTIYLFLLGYGMSRLSILTVGWFSPGWIIYLVLPVSTALLSFRFYFFWPFFSPRAKAIRLLLLSTIIVPVFWSPFPDGYVVMRGVEARVTNTGGADQLQKWALSTIENVSQDVNDLNDLDRQIVNRDLWSEQVRQLHPLAQGIFFIISDDGTPFIEISLAASFTPGWGIAVGLPTLEPCDLQCGYIYQYRPGVYGCFGN